jgi:inhibitor of KinA sporulation pathway (predicted exonuclease)
MWKNVFNSNKVRYVKSESTNLNGTIDHTPPIVPKKYFMVVDFEANCSSNGSRDHEIIEFPAVLVNSVSGEIISEFRTFVKMTKHKALSQFIKDLTHITDEQVANGMTWSDCITAFEKWCLDYDVTSENTTIVTCGDWDLKTMLPNQLKFTKTKFQSQQKLFKKWSNVKVPFEMYTKTKAKGMEGMLKYFKLPLTGHHHSGIDDSRNIVKICKALLESNCDITIPTN